MLPWILHAVKTARSDFFHNIWLPNNAKSWNLP